jgi:hypothetical protein
MTTHSDPGAADPSSPTRPSTIFGYQRLRDQLEKVQREIGKNPVSPTNIKPQAMNDDPKAMPQGVKPSLKADRAQSESRCLRHR